MRRVIVYLLYLLLFLALLFGPSFVRWLNFYGLDGGDRQDPPSYEAEDVAVRVPTPAAAGFVDEPDLNRPGVNPGIVILDLAHSNDFTFDEISYLDNRLAARGVELVPFEEGNLANALRPASGLIVISPMNAYEDDEVRAVSDFVDRGGRVLLVGDPTRFDIEFEEDELGTFIYNINNDEIPLNSLANAFDLVFNGDYLYNTVENEGNFRNIILSAEGLGSSELTKDIEKLAFYGSHSIQAGPGGQAVLRADRNTWSSATDRPGGLALAAVSANERVLGIGDIDFLSEPYFTVYDNSRFIAHIADHLSNADRSLALSDFPYFFEKEIKLVYSGDPELGPDAFDEIISLQETLRTVGRKLTLSDEASATDDVVYLGLYNQSGDVEDQLDAAGVVLIIDPPLEDESTANDEETSTEDALREEEAIDESESNKETNDSEDNGQSSDEEETEEIRRIESEIGNVGMSGTALIFLQEVGDRREMVVLAASAEGLENTVNRLIDLIPFDAEGSLSDCLLHEKLALCPTGVDDEPVEAKLETSGKSDETGPTESGPDEGDSESVDEEEEESEESTEESEEESPEIDAVEQGEIALDESVDGTLEEDQSHAWIFDSGPAIINIILEGGDDLDGVLELYGPDGELRGASDSSFAGGEERMDLMDIPDDQEYTIVVRDFFNDGADYTLTVESVTLEDVETTEQGELTFDAPVEAELAEGETHAWTFTTDEPIEVDITLMPSEEMDGVLLLFAPDDRLIAVGNDNLEGEEETLSAVSLEGSGLFTVVVGDFTGGGGQYTLLLTLSG